jgi:hypothetical protein
LGGAASITAPPSSGAILGAANPVLDAFQSQGYRGSSLTPSVSAPSPSRRIVTPAPPVLPIPKRKF